ncbi:MAG: 50S ribosomal protein L13 [bacterium]
MDTYMPKLTDIQRKWLVVDAAGQTLGRLASEVAAVLRGKHKPIFTPHLDTGDYVIVVNADKVVLTGNKLEQKFHYRHSGYPGGIKAESYGRMLAVKPEKVVEIAVKGMLPHNRLGRAMGKKLKVYRGPDHPHSAQKPETMTIKG